MTRIKNIVIVGGGSAGWLTAGLIAAKHCPKSGEGLLLTLVESPDLPSVGVGEGTWPSMRSTLQKIGLSESDFIRQCDASFKQGTKFVDWRGDASNDVYFHPFSFPTEYATLNLAQYWLSSSEQLSFAEVANPQTLVAASGLAPKQLSTPEYAFNLNYGYHLDATKFANVLRQHILDHFSVKHVVANVNSLLASDNGDVSALLLDDDTSLEGDLFIDCSGARSILVGKHYQTKFHSLKESLFNDRAIAVQLPYEQPDSEIASTTTSTALTEGWVWDIGLQTRRGIGYVYSSKHSDASNARKQLQAYLRKTAPFATQNDLAFRDIAFEPGHYERFWVNNCVAVGMSAGFIEPLEASALAMVEQAANMIADQMPQTREIMTVLAKRFDRKMQYHWSSIVDFLKLHYVLSKRDDSQYWKDCRKIELCSEELREKLILWQQQAPWHDDAPRIDELFPSASFQYVLYGMGFNGIVSSDNRINPMVEQMRAASVIEENKSRVRQMMRLLPSNRLLIAGIRSAGLRP